MTASLEFPTQPTLNGFLAQDIQILQDAGQHDLAVVRLSRLAATSDTLVQGAPAVVRIDRKVVYGYVHHYDIAVKDVTRKVDLTLIGASMVMMEPGQTTWPDTTVGEIVAEIGRKNRLAVEVDDLPSLGRRTTQAGMSDWQFLRKTAQDTGCFVHCEGTTIQFKKWAPETTRSRLEAPVFRFDQQGYTDVYDFTPSIGETGEDGADRVARVLGGVDPRSAIPFVASNAGLPARSTRLVNPSALFSKVERGTVAHSHTEASERLSAYSNSARWVYQATAELRGDARLRPGLQIYLSRVAGGYGGFWTVIGARHHWSNGVYRTFVSLGADSLGDSNPAAGGTLVGGTRRVIESSDLDRVVGRQPRSILRQASPPDSPVRPNDPDAFRAGNLRWAAEFQPAKPRVYGSVPSVVRRRREARRVG